MAEVFEQRAKAAEELVRQLEAEIGTLRAQAEAELSAKLTKENEELRGLIQAAKSKLRAAQSAHGKPNYPIPGEQSSSAAAAPKGGAAAAAAASPSPAPVPAAAAAAAAKPKEDKGKKEEKPKQDKPKEDKGGKKKEAAPAATPAAADDEKVDVSRIDFRVGRVVSAKKHPEADKLYLEDVDLAEGKNRTVLSGLADYIPLEQLQGRLVILCTNLPPRKMKGIESQAMIMCANDGSKVEIIDPPAGAVPGDRVVFAEYPGTPDPVLNPKKKIFETVVPDLKTNGELVATYKGAAFTIQGKGVCKVQSLANCGIK